MANDLDVRALTRAVKDLSANVKSLEKTLKQANGRPTITNCYTMPNEESTEEATD